MPTTTIPVSAVRCWCCSATALRSTYARLGWLRTESAWLDYSGRRVVTFTCPSCHQNFPAEPGMHSGGNRAALPHAQCAGETSRRGRGAFAEAARQRGPTGDH
jgi:hypothetical protein